MNKKEYRIIIFEGADCSGKSTIKSALEKETGYKHICIDRLFITSLVYNKVMNRNRRLNNDIECDMFNFINAVNPIFVFVNTHSDTIWDRIQDRGDDMLKTKEDVIKICNEYKNIFKKITHCDKGFRVIEIDGDNSVKFSVRRVIDGIC